MKTCRKDGLKLNYPKKRIRNLIPSIPVKIYNLKLIIRMIALFFCNLRGKEVTSIYVIIIDTIRLLISVMINPFIDIAHVKYI